MPIHDLGYRSWDGEFGSRSRRWTVIALTGVKIAWKSSWLRRVLILSWIPAVYWGVAFFAYEQWLKDSLEQRVLYQGAHQSEFEHLHARDFRREFGRTMMARSVEFLPDSEIVVREIENSTSLDSTRPLVWRWLLMSFIRIPQGTLLMMIIGMLAPPLIANDVRSKAFLLYFSRPMSRLQYILGKMAILWAYLALITTLPALVLYALGVLLSPNLSVVIDTWDLPVRIFAASLVVMIPTTSLALMLSSLTAESRFAGFAWFAIWAMGFAAWLAMQLTEDIPQRWSSVSLYHAMGTVEKWIFGLSNDPGGVGIAAILLGLITFVSLRILVHRVSAPMRV